MSRFLCAWLQCILLLSSVASATIIAGNKNYASMPAVFGKIFHRMSSYTAHLQLPDDNPFLCQSEAGLSSPMNERRDLKGSHNKTHQMVIPTDGIPVALLVSRGGCSFEEKARTAMTFDFVEYVIVFDDRPHSTLVPMSATDPDGITVGMLFVSHSTGLQLHKLITKQPGHMRRQGGMLITMDARSPSLPPSYNETQQWMLAAMAGFFTFLACFGCLLVCIQVGYIPADGRIYIGRLGPHGGIGERRRLLTEAQVYGLPTRSFSAGQVEDAEEEYQNAAVCAICIEEYQEGETLRVLPCSHKFHTDCIVPWLTERQASCPLCKQEIHGVDDGIARGWWWWLSWRRNGRNRVPTRDLDDNVETPQATLVGAENASVQDPSTTAVPPTASNDNEANADEMISTETS